MYKKHYSSKQKTKRGKKKRKEKKKKKRKESELLSQFRFILNRVRYKEFRCNGYRRRIWTRRHEFKSST